MFHAVAAITHIVWKCIHHSKKMMKKHEQRPEGNSSHVYCEGLDTDEADEGCRILEET